VRGSDFWFCTRGRDGQCLARGTHVAEVVGGPAYDEELVGHLLVLLGHGVRSGLSEHADGAEKSEADTETDGNAPGNAGAGTRGIDGTGTVGTESDPVSCQRSRVSYEPWLSAIAMHLRSCCVFGTVRELGVRSFI
jgi:hypothetical protein